MTETTQDRQEISGKWLVLGMFAFGILATSILWVYWKLHVMPFMPLQMALAEKYEDSSPRVEGGQSKIHAGTPRILRIVMRSEFDPVSEADRAEVRFDQVLEIVRENLDLEEYEQVHLHLYFEQPEQELVQETLIRSVEAAEQVEPEPMGSEGSVIVRPAERGLAFSRLRAVK